ncbi:MAG: hypothetical protein ACXIVF_17095 [Rhizobiaceae bacterium]
MATIRMMRLSTDKAISRPLVALLSVMLILSVWLHAAPGHAENRPSDLQFLVESGDHGLMVLPRETLEQRSREDDAAAGGPPAALDADLSVAPGAPASFVSRMVAWHVPPAPAADPATNPAAPRAPPFSLSL